MILDGNEGLEIHVIKRKRTGLIKTKDLQLPSLDDLIGRNGIYFLLFQLLNSVNDADDHTDRQSRCDCNGNEIQASFKQHKGLNDTPQSEDKEDI